MNSKEELFYVDESVFVLVRYSMYLYEIVKGNGYLGFTKEILENNNITIVFILFDSILDKENRKEKEKNIIKNNHPKYNLEKVIG